MRYDEPDDGLRRLESWAGEVRVNWFRLVAILFFYGNHLVNYYWGSSGAPVSADYHSAVTLITILWGISVLFLHQMLSQRWYPPALKYLVTAWDLVLITAIVCLTREARTTLVVLYFLVIAAAPLRLSLALVYGATLGSICGFLFFLAYIRFWLEIPADQRLSRVEQMIIVSALGGAGLLAGQAIRQITRLLRGYPVTMAEPEET
ncbi:MAG TPA: hypothetical protein VGY58_14515, partial [Gemmataceae bacterium]|nr:hypothetical protein [Gemmataceae bacterium]